MLRQFFVTMCDQKFLCDWFDCVFCHHKEEIALISSIGVSKIVKNKLDILKYLYKL